MKNVNREMLVHAIVDKTDLSKKDVEAVLECTLDVITGELQKGNRVTLTGFVK